MNLHLNLYVNLHINLAFLQESSEILAESHGKAMAFWKDSGKELEKEVDILT